MNEYVETILFFEKHLPGLLRIGRKSIMDHASSGHALLCDIARWLDLPECHLHPAWETVFVPFVLLFAPPITESMRHVQRLTRKRVAQYPELSSLLEAFHASNIMAWKYKLSLPGTGTDTAIRLCDTDYSPSEQLNGIFLVGKGVIREPQHFDCAEGDEPTEEIGLNASGYYVGWSVRCCLIAVSKLEHWVARRIAKVSQCQSIDDDDEAKLRLAKVVLLGTCAPWRLD